MELRLPPYSSRILFANLKKIPVTICLQIITRVNIMGDTIFDCKWIPDFWKNVSYYIDLFLKKMI